MKNLAQGWLSRLKNLAENQKWIPERALFNDTNERFQLGRTAEKIDLGDNRQNFDKVKPREIVVKFGRLKSLGIDLMKFRHCVVLYYIKLLY